jgi:hypothetical protein
MSEPEGFNTATRSVALLRGSPTSSSEVELSRKTNSLTARRVLLGVLHATEKRRKNKGALGHLMETFVGKTRTAAATLQSNEVQKAKKKGHNDFVGF